MFDCPRYRVARAAAKKSSEVLMDFFGRDYEVRSKSSYNLVTDADFASEKEIFRIIKESFPDDAVLGEESNSADISADHLWIVDPLDGTNNFVHGVEHFGISIAYYYRRVPEMGIVVRPPTDDWYVCRRNQGAYYNKQRARVSNDANLNEILVAVGFYYDRGQLMRGTLDAMRKLFEQDIHGIRRMGTASLDLCMVGTGAFGAYFEFELSAWDFAAGRLFVEEAGGRVTDCRGNVLSVGKSSILATNGLVHQTMTDFVSPSFVNQE